APIEMHHLGWGIWSQIRRITGASLNGTRPAQMSTSACRGENDCRSMPNRAISNRLAAVAMYSMAQQAVPNGIGQSELARAQLARKSSRVVMKFSDSIDTTEDEPGPDSSRVFAVAGLTSPIRRLPASRHRRTPPRG